jgi:uncharacterized protein
VIPSEKECYDLMEKYRMLDNIREHSIVTSGVQLSVDKAVAGALLHDIAKTQCLQTGGDHAALGREICVQHQLDEIADIVAEHIWLKSYSLDGLYSEKEIVYYADKRVLHTSVVSLDERMDDIINRYSRYDSKLTQGVQMNFTICKGIERKLFGRLDFGPDQLADMVQLG